MRLPASFFCTLVVAVEFVVTLSGCTPDGPKTYPVSGLVTWEGAPLPEGHIVLMSPSNDVTPAAAPIRDGKYSLQAQAGPKVVQIQATREARSGLVDPAMGAVPKEQYLPEQYNTKTTLSAEIKTDGENRFDFHLVAKP